MTEQAVMHIKTGKIFYTDLKACICCNVWSVVVKDRPEDSPLEKRAYVFPLSCLVPTGLRGED